jgi:hypothetical protein
MENFLLLKKITLNMKKTVFLSFLIVTSLFLNAQNGPKKSGAVSSKASKPLANQAISNEIPKATICFNESDVAENIVKTRTSFYCSIFLFSSVSEAESFASTFKYSDSNIIEFAFAGLKNGYYYFNFSIKEPKDIKWYLELFKKNNLQYIKYNNDLQSLEKALSN